VFEAAMQRVLRGDRPAGTLTSVFDTFSGSIRSGALSGRLGEPGLMGEFFGIHEDNVRAGR
jgi:hypothetical protein